jgi:hypothetical protein
MPWKFRSKYVHLVNHLKLKSGVLSENSNDYLVVRWRRGDQLTSDVRCTNVKNGNYSFDSSVNCGSVDSFIDAVREQLRNLIEVPYNYASPIPVYIATNEDNRTVLDRLAKDYFIIGEHLFGDKRDERREGNHNKHKMFISVEKYILELILMCESRFLFIYGMTSSNFMVAICCPSIILLRIIRKLLFIMDFVCPTTEHEVEKNWNAELQCDFWIIKKFIQRWISIEAKLGIILSNALRRN